MQAGYLTVETHHEHVGWARFAVLPVQPEPQAAATQTPRIRHITRFNDSEAALMHIHERLKRTLIDADSHLYRVNVERAIATVESLDLRKQTLYTDPFLDDAARSEIERLTAEFVAAGRRRDILLQTVGYIAIGILLFNLVTYSLA